MILTSLEDGRLKRRAIKLAAKHVEMFIEAMSQVSEGFNVHDSWHDWLIIHPARVRQEIAKSSDSVNDYSPISHEPDL